MDCICSGRCAAEAADSPGDSRVAYTFTCTPGLSVNWMRSWFKALSRTWESYEEWQSKEDSVSGGLHSNISQSSIFQPQSFHPTTWIMNQKFFFLLKRCKCLYDTGNTEPAAPDRGWKPYQVKGRRASGLTVTFKRKKFIFSYFYQNKETWFSDSCSVRQRYCKWKYGLIS